MIRSRAAVLRGPDEPYAVEEVMIDAPRPGEVLVRVVGAGLCHTDLIGRSGYFGPDFYPVILGHEGAGVVDRVGEGVTAVAPEDHVVLTFDSCGTCPPCLHGSPAYCMTFRERNLSGRRLDHSGSARDTTGKPITSRWFAQSSFSEYSIATERNVVRVDPEAPLGLLGPLGCGVQTGAGAVLNELRVRPGQRIVVFGVGAVGLSAVMAAKLAGAGEIVAVDLNPARLTLAVELGATRTVNAAADDLTGAVLAGGPGFDFSVDTTGVGTVMSTAVGVLAWQGRCALIGGGADSLNVRPSELGGRSVTYVYEGSAIPQLFIPELIAFWQKGLFPFDRMIQHYKLDELNAAESDARNGVAVKPVLLMGSA
jgi:aryl-alcohol dehydrogenase